MKDKTFPYLIFYPLHQNYSSSNCQIKIFKWCLEGSTPPHNSTKNVACPHITTLKFLLLRICSSNMLLKFDNYDEAPYNVSSYPPSSQDRSLCHAIYLPPTQVELTSHLSLDTPTNPFLKCTISKSLIYK